MAIMRCLISYSVAGATYVASATLSYAGEVGHSAEHASSGGLPQFDPTWFASQVFWLFVCFALLYLIFAKKTLPSISSTIDRRRQQIESDVETTEELAKESEAVYEAYQSSLKESQAKARAVIVDMENALKAKAETNHSKFREKAEKTIAETEASIEEAKKTALKDVQKIATEVATETAKKLLERDVDAKNVKSIVSTLSKDTVAAKKKTTKKAA